MELSVELSLEIGGLEIEAASCAEKSSVKLKREQGSNLSADLNMCPVACSTRIEKSVWFS